MFKFIGKALAGLVLTKEGREAASQLAVAKGLLPKPPPSGDDEAGPDEAPGRAMTSDRAELIRQAMAVRAAKQEILADLDDETRAKLVGLAMKALLNEGRDTKE